MRKLNRLNADECFWVKRAQGVWGRQIRKNHKDNKPIVTLLDFAGAKPKQDALSKMQDVNFPF
ncbi:MAG TPA: hypothetical protein DCY35_10240, partial [Prolixibacteraceae bacterium]|nr:hypothetical protein [Prolixibacteraceae bacterium]